MFENQNSSLQQPHLVMEDFPTNVQSIALRYTLELILPQNTCFNLYPQQVVFFHPSSLEHFPIRRIHKKPTAFTSKIFLD